MTASGADDLIVIGTLGRAHGLKGEISLQYFADSYDWLDGPLWFRSGESGPTRPARALSHRLHKGSVLVRFEGVEDRTAAEQLRGVSVLIPADALPESDAETWYIHDLIGLAVLHGEDRVGTLAHVDFAGGQELWVIEDENGREVLFPAVPEFVEDVDLQAGTIRILPPPGLLDLYQQG